MDTPQTKSLKTNDQILDLSVVATLTLTELESLSSVVSHYLREKKETEYQKSRERSLSKSLRDRDSNHYTPKEEELKNWLIEALTQYSIKSVSMKFLTNAIFGVDKLSYHSSVRINLVLTKMIGQGLVVKDSSTRPATYTYTK